MAISVEEEFISNFHNLNGITIGERRKSLFLLLNKTKQTLELNDTKIDFSFLCPQTALEESFKVEAMIYFRKNLELLDVLKSGNPVLSKRILKTKWFIKGVFETMSGEELVNTVLSELSYNIKLKLLNILGLYLKDANIAEEFFEIVKQNYGIHLATKLLVACSANVIMKTIEMYKIEITPRQLLIIIKRYPDITEKIFEKLNSANIIATKYKYVFEYLARNDSRLFLRLKEKYKPILCLGSKSTNKFILKEKESFLKYPRKYCGFLKKRRISKCVVNDFDEFYVNFFPKSLDNFDKYLDDYLYLLKHFKSNEEKLNYLLKTFKKVNGSELWEYPIFIKPKLIEMMSPDDRMIWMEKYTRPEHISEEEWISFMRIEKSLPLLKERISSASKRKARIIVGFLIKTCKLNNEDNISLLEVLKYFIKEHRNNHIDVKQSFMHMLDKHFDFRKFGNEHWKIINELIPLATANNELLFHISFREKYIHYCFENGLPIIEPEWYRKDSCRFGICKDNPEYEKKFLMISLEIIPKVHKDKNELEQAYMYYLESLINFNKGQPDSNKIYLFISDDAIECLVTCLKNGRNYLAASIAETFIRFDIKKCEETQILQSLFEHPHYHNQMKVFNWLIKSQPLFICSHLELIINNFLNMSALPELNIYWFKYMDHLDILPKITKICLDVLNLQHESASKKRMALIFLSVILEPKHFISLVSKHFEIIEDTLKTCLKNTSNPLVNLDLVQKLCRDKKLKLAQNSLDLISKTQLLID
ncbi:hypothetical protein ILUMI_07219 [Ignelater luminosus]|uniref:Uncharacterized protein n=1 Tax=Ignelater luminosus TaxID=2038154 RepID=A0A8K0D3X7_IGNLU|nr:hypothetical protein ILUMI_07219 [Ignelater luminosus]